MKYAVLILAAACVAFLVVRGMAIDGLVIDRPEWMDSKRVDVEVPLPADVEVSPKAASAAAPVRAQADVVESPISLMAPLPVIAESLRVAEQRFEFNATAILNADLRDGVAREMVEATSKHWKMYQMIKHDEKAPTAQVLRMDYLFAVWPDLPALIADKKVVVHVRPKNRTGEVGVGHITYTYLADAGKKELSVNFHLPSWAVSVVFGEHSALPDMHRLIHDDAVQSLQVVGNRAK